MTWYAWLTLFLGGALLANAVPHLMAGIARRPFPTPFASPPFTGLSSPAVNVAWAAANLALAYVLLARVRPIDPGERSQVAVVLAGFVLMTFVVVRSIRRRG